MDKILLMGELGYYYTAQRTKDGIGLKSDKLGINARTLIPYGFPFNFGKDKEENFGICRYSDAPLMKDGKFPKNKSDYGRINLDRVIEGLEGKIEEFGADYILIDNFQSKDMRNYWEISGRAQLLIKKS